jgi:phosphohistidine phosphatase
MKLLGLLRHAQSDAGMSVRDFDRGLDDRGRRDAALIGKHIAAQPIAWDLVIASPAARVRATLESSGLPIPVRFDERAYLADVATLLDLLRRTDGDPAAVLLAGHNPGLHELLFRLVDPDQDDAAVSRATAGFPTAAFAVVELPIDAWNRIQPGNARLVSLTRPADLARSG